MDALICSRKGEFARGGKLGPVDTRGYHPVMLMSRDARYLEKVLLQKDKKHFQVKKKRDRYPLAVSAWLQKPESSSVTEGEVEIQEPST